MVKIKKRRFDLIGKVIYREKSDCSYWYIAGYNSAQGVYEAVNVYDEHDTFTPSDFIGDYIV